MDSHGYVCRVLRGMCNSEGVSCVLFLYDLHLFIEQSCGINYLPLSKEL